MRVMCSYCRKEMDEKEPSSDTRISHSMCVPCSDIEMAAFKPYDLGDRLRNLDRPVIVLTGERRLIACNTMTERILGRPLSAMRGLKAGEFLACARSRQVKGCGGNLECEDCAIRKTLAQTFETGVGEERVPALLHTDHDGTPVVRDLLISVDRAGDYLRVVIDRMT